jgi:hypothetical protein
VDGAYQMLDPRGPGPSCAVERLGEQADDGGIVAVDPAGDQELRPLHRKEERRRETFLGRPCVALPCQEDREPVRACR